MPGVDAALTGERILAMQFMEGEHVETLVDAGQETRNRVVRLLLELFFRELFEFRLMQTDPNLGNYFYRPEDRRIVLLDFGSTVTFRRCRFENVDTIGDPLFVVTDSSTLNLVDSINKDNGVKEFEMEQLCKRFAMDCIGRVAFSMDFEAIKKPENNLVSI